MQDKTQQIFRDAPVPKAVLTNVIPSIISMLMVLVYNLADTFFIGQTKDPLMVAAVSIATPAFIIFMAVGMLFGIGGTSMISRMLGEGKRDMAKHISAFCFWTGAAIGVIAMIIMTIFSVPVCRLIGASDATIGYASQYLSIVAIGIPFLIVSNSFSNIIRSEGHATVAMTGMIIGNMINIVLDPVMIIGFKWYVAGAAVATVLGNIFSTVFYIIHLTSKRSILSIKPKDYSAKRIITLGVLSIGIPASLNSILMSFSNIMINSFMAKHGDLQLASVLADSFVISFFRNISIDSSESLLAIVLYSCTTVLLIFITLASFSTNLPLAASGNNSGFSLRSLDIPSTSRIIS